MTTQGARLLQAGPETRVVSWVGRGERQPAETPQRRAGRRADQALAEQSESRQGAAKWRDDGPALRLATEPSNQPTVAATASPWKGRIPPNAVFYDEMAALTETPQPGAMVSVRV